MFKMLKFYLFFVVCGAVLFISISAIAQDPGHRPDQHNAACTVTGGVTTYPVGSTCATDPTTYAITIFSLAVCQREPSPPTGATSAGLEAAGCHTFFSSAGGSETQIVEGKNASLVGTITRPPNGTYLYGAYNLHPMISVSTNIDFGVGQVFEGEGSGAGRFCATKGGSVPSEATTICADLSAPTAAVMRETIFDFNDEQDPGTLFANTWQGTYSGQGGSIIQSKAFLLGAGSQFLSSEAASTTRVIGWHTFAAPLTITINTTAIDVAFKKTEALYLGTTGGVMDFYIGPPLIEITSD